MSTTMPLHDDRALVADDALRTVLVAGARPARPNALSASLTHGWRAMLKIKHVPEQLFDVTMFPAMMLLMFTYLFGGAFMGSTGEYLQFFLPGIVVSTVLMTSMYTGVGLNVDMEKGIADRFRSLPMWRPSAIVGPLLGDAFRYTMASIVMLGLGFALGFRPDGGVLAVIPAIAIVLAFAFSASWIWSALGIVMRTEKAVMSTAMMILFPLTFASNIYVDPETMPGWLHRFVDLNPVSWVTTAVRGTMNGDVSAADLGKVFAACAVLIAVFAPLTMRLYRNKR